MRERDRTKSTYSEVIYGCGVGVYCDGICAELHRKDCPCFYKYKWEFNKKYPHGKKKVCLDNKTTDELFDKRKKNGKSNRI